MSRTILADASRTATAQSAAQLRKPGQKGVALFVEVGTVSGTSPTLDITLEGKDSVGAQWHAMPNAAMTQITATGRAYFRLYPGATTDAGVAADGNLPNEWRVVGTIGGTATPTFQYSVSAEELE